jgi:DNA-binding transcriptional ArsR family regulator
MEMREQSLGVRPTPGVEILTTALLLKSLSEAPRLQLLVMLADRPFGVGEVVSTLGLTYPTASTRLNALRSAGLVEATRIGKHVDYRLTASGRRIAALVSRLGQE